MPSAGKPARNHAAWPALSPASGRPASAGARKSKKKRQTKNIAAVTPEVEMANFGLSDELEGGMYARLLVSRLGDPSPIARTWAAQAMGCLGASAQLQVQPLHRMLFEDVDERARSAAGKALVRIQGKSVPPATLAAADAAEKFLAASARPRSAGTPASRRRRSAGKRPGSAAARRPASASTSRSRPSSGRGR
mmetsp:Transcript_7373/g.13086  ORF Transcript_7373/g.13086 Transcript_7373/m.13086 type:complete len:193 (+) Transcript_7373:49-627(+)